MRNVTQEKVYLENFKTIKYGDLESFAWIDDLKT
jgi:hypothetical protein